MYRLSLHIHHWSRLDDLKFKKKCDKSMKYKISVLFLSSRNLHSWSATVLPVEVVWRLLLTFRCRLWLTEQLYDGQSLVTTVMMATALWPRCFLFTAMLWGVLDTTPSDGDLQLTSRCPLLKSLTIQTSKVQPSLSPDRWTGGARDASTLPSTPPKRWWRTTF